MKCAVHCAVKVISRHVREHTIEKTIHTYFIADLGPLLVHYSKLGIPIICSFVFVFVACKELSSYVPFAW